MEPVKAEWKHARNQRGDSGGFARGKIRFKNGGHAGQDPQARLMAVITEGTVTIIVKHPIGLATQKGDDHVRLSIIIVVLKR